MCWKICFFRTKDGSSEALQTHVNRTKTLCIRHRLVFVEQCFKIENLGSLFSVQTITMEYYPHLFSQFVALLEENGRDW